MLRLFVDLFKMIADQDEIWKYKLGSMKLLSKSYKQMYMEWIQGKVFRQEQLMSNWSKYRWNRTPCVISFPPRYPARPTGSHQFEPIGGFQQHPNSTQNL